jgi:hypothetical protein
MEWRGRVQERRVLSVWISADTLKYTGHQLNQNFQTFEAHISLRNTVPTEFGLLYHPNFKVSVFSDNHTMRRGTEANTVLNLPLEKHYREGVRL